MRFASLLSTTFTVFAGLSLVGSLASARSVPTVSVMQLTPTGRTPVPLPNAKAFFSARGNYHVQTVPYFAFHQPQGTRPAYRKDGRGRIVGIDFVNARKRAVRKLEINWLDNSNKIGNVAIRDLPFKSYPDTNVLTGFGANNAGLQQYRIVTSRTSIDLKAPRAGDYTNMFVNVLPDRKNFALNNILPWDGKSLPLAPGPKVVGT
ncbi:hypothetical protein THASP1DRAFT_33623 [Thamnocephalis sphaerospora]|uniref:Uncharacterized protein n=1 Tax=Thamnocephalis sphaerospora TaxID=78915 RepID=A0A4P9XG41_9FUNG|nr:hypothetical protein THASP1DRAFT_33623 [Thamnocephalis sphaerospora]|eukprot:RKP04593.1 hypothetical protein THASP1DRAFT_33623 [Thamnocephalis sphaerospora]